MTPQTVKSLSHLSFCGEYERNMSNLCVNEHYIQFTSHTLILIYCQTTFISLTCYNIDLALKKKVISSCTYISKNVYELFNPF